MRTRTETLRLVRMSAIACGILIIVAYAIWRSLNYARGPEILIFEPTPGATIASSTLLLKGKALRIINITLNGSSISVDQEGNFIETVAVFPGVNKILIQAEDRFKRTTNKELTVYGSSQFPSKRIIDGDVLESR